MGIPYAVSSSSKEVTPERGRYILTDEAIANLKHKFGVELKVETLKISYAGKGKSLYLLTFPAAITSEQKLAALTEVGFEIEILCHPNVVKHASS